VETRETSKKKLHRPECLLVKTRFRGGGGERAREGECGANTVYTCKWKNDTYSKNGEREIKENDGRGEFKYS
jgi:hypothetical protein